MHVTLCDCSVCSVLHARRVGGCCVNVPHASLYALGAPQLQALPGVAGLHVMPITRPAKRMALQLIQQGALVATPPPTRGAPLL